MAGTEWEERAVRFEVEAHAGAAGLVALLPARKPPWALREISKDGSSLPFDTVTLKGIEYGMFYAESGNYEATYGDPSAGEDQAGPAVLHLEPEPGSSGVDSTVSLRVVFDEPVSEASVNTSTFVLRDDTGRLVPADVRVLPEAREATLIPLEPLAAGAMHSASLRGGFKAPRIQDQTANPLESSVVWSFETAKKAWPSSAQILALIAGFALMIGVPALHARRGARSR